MLAEFFLFLIWLFLVVVKFWKNEDNLWLELNKCHCVEWNISDIAYQQ